MKLNKSLFKSFIIVLIFWPGCFLFGLTHNTFVGWIPFAFFSFILILFLWKLWQFRKLNPEINPTPYQLISVIFTSDSIVFPNGYFFRCSKIKKGKDILAQRISQINLNTFPPSFVLDDCEIIFIKPEYKDELENFGGINNIPVVNRVEIWELLCEPYLDTEFEEDHKNNTIKQLIENGISQKEIEAIRSKIKLTMLGTNAFVWEWAHLGQFDYVHWKSFVSCKTYWWTMEIALRNYSVNKNSTINKS